MCSFAAFKEFDLILIKEEMYLDDSFYVKAHP